MKFENDLGAAYANNKGMDKVIEDYEEPTTEVENNNKEGYDDLKEAYANNEDMEEVIEDHKEAATESRVEVASFEEVGKQKWASAFEKISNFSDNLAENGKKAIYTATGIAFEAPGIAKETAKTAVETGKEAYGSAKESFAGAVDSAKEKAREVKTNLVERAEKTKKSFFERIIKTKDKYIDKAAELTDRGVKWGVKTGEQVAVKVIEVHDRVAEAIREARIEALKNDMEKGRIAEIKLEILEREKVARENTSSMNNAFKNVGELSV